MKPTTVRRPDLAAGLTGPVGPLGTNFMGPEILPVRLVGIKSDTFAKPVFSDKALTIDVDALKRSAKAGYQRLNYRTTSDTFTCQDEGLEDGVDDVQGADVQDWFNAEQDCANGVFLNLQRAAETSYSSYLFDAATLFVSYTADVSTEWSTAATATPYNDVQDAVVKILGQVGGVIPAGVELCLAVSHKVFRNLEATADIQKRLPGGTYNLKSTARQAVSEQEMADCLDINRVFQGRARNGSTDIWDDEYALVFLRAVGQDMAIPQLGRTFVWQEDGAERYIVETYREEPRQTVVLVRNNVQRYAFNPACGYLLGNITA